MCFCYTNQCDFYLLDAMTDFNHVNIFGEMETSKDGT